MQPLTPYVLRERSPRKALGGVVMLVCGLVWCLVVWRLVHGPVWFAVAGAVAAVVVGGRAAVFPEPALEAGPQGFRLGAAVVPWPSLWQVVVVVPADRTGPSPPVEIGVRLHRGAPLPGGMSSVVYDPREPNALQGRRSFGPGQVDVDRLAAAVHAFGRAEVVESRGGVERRIA